MTMSECTTNDIITELRCRLDLSHFPPHVALLVERAFDKLADGGPDGLIGLLRAARHLTIDGSHAEHYRQLASTIARTQAVLEQEAEHGTRSR